MKHLRITVEGKSYDVEVELLDEAVNPPLRGATSLAGVQSSTSANPASTTEKTKPPAPASAREGDILSPLSAVVVSIDIAVGDTVEQGQKVVTLEAMKMNTIVPAPVAGTVEVIRVSAGDAVDEGQPLISLR